MKWLTYPNQIFLGIVVLGVGHLLSWLTEISWLMNLGWIFYGLLFVLHPVWSERVNHHPRRKLYTQIAGVVVILIGLTLRTGGGDTFWYERISDSLGVDISEGTILVGTDNHSGFHGDGTMYAELEFSDETLESAISTPGGWHVLPLTDNLQTLIYGTRSPEASVGPFIGITMPRVERGYWFFYDRQGDTADDGAVLSRGSYNYTFAVYDADADRLYYCEYDT